MYFNLALEAMNLAVTGSIIIALLSPSLLFLFIFIFDTKLDIIPNNFVPPPPMAYQPPPPPNLQPPPPPPNRQPPPPPVDDGIYFTTLFYFNLLKVCFYPLDMNLKQVVEALAMQHNVTFLPTRRRHENGSQVSLIIFYSPFFNYYFS
jgi:hypothetical protein